MDQNIRPIRNAELVEVVLNQNQQKFTLPITENIRGKKVTGIEVYKIADVSKSPLGRDNCNDTAFLKGTLTLQVEGKERIKDMPLRSLVASNNNGLIKSLKPVEIAFEKSYVYFADNGNLAANEVVLIMFYFED